MELVANPWFYAVAIPAVLIIGISKAGIGGGLGIVAVPLMTLVIAPVQAAAVMLPILCIMDIAGLWAYRGKWHRRNMAIMLPGALAGLLICALSFRYLSDDAVRLILGAVALGFVLYRLAGAAIANKNAGRPSEPGPRGIFWATLSGFTSFIAHSGAPPLQVYLLPQKLDKTLYVGTMVVFFTVMNYAKIIPYALLGQLSAVNMLGALALLPAIPLGVWLGLRFHGMVSERLFYAIVYTVLTVTGVRLVWQGVGGVMG